MCPCPWIPHLQSLRPRAKQRVLVQSPIIIHFTLPDHSNLQCACIVSCPVVASIQNLCPHPSHFLVSPLPVTTGAFRTKAKGIPRSWCTLIFWVQLSWAVAKRLCRQPGIPSDWLHRATTFRSGSPSRPVTLLPADTYRAHCWRWNMPWKSRKLIGQSALFCFTTAHYLPIDGAFSYQVSGSFYLSPCYSSLVFCCASKEILRVIFRPNSHLMVTLLYPPRKAASS